MANIKSAKKAIGSSKRKKTHNLSWKNRIKQAVKNLETLLKSEASSDQISKSFSQAQKVLDKAAKENVLHKNKSNRLKSKFALKLKGNASKPTAKKSTKSSR
jgi:small subunit ribosomal protein S20